jgi:uncharacterized protein (TIGR02145 family)
MQEDMEKVRKPILILSVFVLLFSLQGLSGSYVHSITSESDRITQKVSAKTWETGTKQQDANTKSKQTVTKSKTGKAKPTQQSSKVATNKKLQVSGTITIGEQTWAVANLNVITFRNGDTIPEARTNQEWVAAGAAHKPAWCYYNNDTVAGKKYGKLYNWYAVNDPRELAPEGWRLSSDEDWSKLVYYLGGPGAAGIKMKSTSGWKDGDSGTNESGFTGLPGGYRIENGIFVNAGSIGIWWSTTESRALNAFDYYLFMSSGIGRSSNPKQRGESVRCLR